MQTYADNSSPDIDIEIVMEVKSNTHCKINELNTSEITDFVLRPGIENNGNECFINSVMQCLGVSPFIHEFLEKYKLDDDNMIKLITKYNLNKLKTDILPSAITKLLETNKSIVKPVQKQPTEYNKYECLVNR